MLYNIVTYGCQMNVHESEKIAGILENMGYKSTESREDADIVVFNTCAIREGAEDRAFGNIGALKPLKKKNPNLDVLIIEKNNQIGKKLKATGSGRCNIAPITNDISLFYNHEFVKETIAKIVKILVVFTLNKIFYL
mgnify:CR=1 FL=1